MRASWTWPAPSASRGTAQARLDKLPGTRVVTGFGPDIDPIALGYAVMAFTTLEIAEGRLADVVAHLRAIPEVLEATLPPGPATCTRRLVAHTNRHLQDVLNRVLEVTGINRATTADRALGADRLPGAAPRCPCRQSRQHGDGRAEQ